MGRGQVIGPFIVSSGNQAERGPWFDRATVQTDRDTFDASCFYPRRGRPAGAVSASSRYRERISRSGFPPWWRKWTTPFKGAYAWRPR